MIEVEVRNLDKVLRKLGPTLYQVPLVRFWDRVGLAFMRDAKKRSPWDLGNLRSSLDKGASSVIWVIARSQPPLWMRIGTRLTSGGFCYGRALDASDRYHYVGGRAKGRGRNPLLGRSTKGWFSDVPRLQSFITGTNRAFKTTAREIEKNWSR